MESSKTYTKDIKSKTPKYTINLDDEPENRWNNILLDYESQMIQMKTFIDGLLIQLGIVGYKASILFGALSSFAKLGLVYQSGELIGISKITGIELGKLVAMQLLYELESSCTSIVTKGKDYPTLSRTLDWDLEILKKITIHVDFKQNGIVLFSGVTFVGYIGLLTCQRPNGYSVSINYRNTGTNLWNNLLQLLLYQWPASFLLREIMSKSDNYKDAVAILSTTKIISPCYFTVCGILDNQGIIITRNRYSYDNLNELSSKNYIVQTNMDNFREDGNDDLLKSSERLKEVKKQFKKLEDIPDDKFLWKLMEIPPIKNDETIYSTIMCPRSNFFETKINLSSEL